MWIEYSNLDMYHIHMERDSKILVGNNNQLGKLQEYLELQMNKLLQAWLMKILLGKHIQQSKNHLLQFYLQYNTGLEDK